MNKNWGNNKSNMDDFIEFQRLCHDKYGLQVMNMTDFLSTIALPGLLSLPLPNNDIHIIRQPLWDYLEAACYSRPWSP